MSAAQHETGGPALHERNAARPFDARIFCETVFQKSLSEGNTAIGGLVPDRHRPPDVFCILRIERDLLELCGRRRFRHPTRYPFNSVPAPCASALA